MVARDGCARSTMRIRVEAANVPKKNASSLGRALALSLSPSISRNERLWNDPCGAKRPFIRKQHLVTDKDR